MKRLIIFVLAFASYFSIATAATFPDVPETHPQYVAIESLKNLEIINGYADGNFGPEGPVNRVEALKMILISAGIEVSTEVTETGFPDASADDWFAPYAVTARALGIVKGDGKTGNLAPARQVNKAEFLKMLIQAFEEDISNHQDVGAISADTAEGQWFLPYLSYAKTLGLIIPSLDNRLEPERFLTRAECAEIIYKLLVIERGGDVQKMLSITESKLVNVLVDLNEDNIQQALTDASDAVFYAEQALSMAPEEGIVQAAHKIARGFKILCLAYKAGLEGDNDLLVQYADEAKELAGLAYEDDPSTQTIGQKIKSQADILLAQVETQE